jgi:hypothetical protein
MPSKGTVVMLGLPMSGKTTFLAALWHQLESSEISTAFVAERLQPDREYLNSIRDSWLAFEEIRRTSLLGERSALLHLQHVATKAQFDLSIPDVAGERFAQQWLDRRLPQEYVTQLQQCFGILLFVHCSQVDRVRVLPAREPEASSQQMVEWDPKYAPMQVRLVDLLQSAQIIFERSRSMRVGVVISAWDEVEERTTTPRSWFAKRLPLLNQFLEANVDTIDSAIFGVSAIGGSLNDRESLALTPSPSARVRVQIDSDFVRDLTRPLEFLTMEDSSR